MSAEEYLDFFGQVYRMQADKRRKRVDELLGQYGLEGDRKRKIGEYSKGMRQKLALARALFHNPPVLLMDEPTSAMDPESARLVRDAIHGLRSDNRAIIICTHNLTEAEELAGKIAIIHRGKIIITGDMEQLKTRLLGAPQFVVQVGTSPNGLVDDLPNEVTLIEHGADWFRYQTDKPLEINPLVIQSLVKKNIPVVGLSEVPRSLEMIYLHAFNSAGSNSQTLGTVEQTSPGGKPHHA
jgi:ABC-2 type transport system ATP-binding protein